MNEQIATAHAQFKLTGNPVKFEMSYGVLIIIAGFLYYSDPNLIGFDGCKKVPAIIYCGPKSKNVIIDDIRNDLKSLGYYVMHRIVTEKMYENIKNGIVFYE